MQPPSLCLDRSHHRVADARKNNTVSDAEMDEEEDAVIFPLLQR